MKTKQRINYVSHHRAASLRMAEDAKLSAIDVSVYNTLFMLWNLAGFPERLPAEPDEVMKMAKVGNIRTYRKALENLQAGDYIEVKSQRGSGGGTFISFADFSGNKDSKWGKSALFEGAANGAKVPYLNGAELPHLNRPNGAKVPHSYKEVQTTDNVVKHPTTVQTFVPNGTSASPSAALAEKNLSVSDYPGNTDHPNMPPAPQERKKKSSAQKRKKELRPFSPLNKAGQAEVSEAPQNGQEEPKEAQRSATKHWAALVEEWFRFYAEKHEGNKPRFRKADTSHFKEIIQALERRAIAKDVAWTEEVAVERLRLFLTHAYGRNWLKTHFLLHNLNSQFDAIVNSKPEQQQPSGKVRSGGAVIGAGNPDLERKLADELEQYLPDSRNASHWPD